MNKSDRMELILIPSNKGFIKIHIYGFETYGAWGQVFAQLNEITVNMKGFHKKKTLIKTLVRLHDTLKKNNL
ncbi:hypothetical protein J2S13_001220 [Oikeobacillus pervagus]|uniref:Uncharacterized protein n=1 Tax=Oikeobacillus pervagus TaxID=1325931 RepID=A0AAJ1SXV0_9BACI|nr:hypothetical protein [Oikeobacillus pervagus]MDQ0214823.1 hypothetical protein [Oikeobacillus pervagus]